MATSYQDIGAIQSSGLPSIGAVQAAGGSTPVNENLTDNLDASYVEVYVLGLGLILSDTLSFSDAAFVPEPLAGVVIVDASWVNVLSDTQQYNVGYFSSFSETLSLSDTVLLNLGFILPSDSLSLTDAVQAFNGVGVVLAEDFTFSDATSNQLYGILSKSIADAFTFSDAIVDHLLGNQTISFFPAKGSSAGQYIIVNGISYPATGDKFNFSDTFNLLLQNPTSFADSLTLSDAVNVLVVSTTPVPEILSDILVLSEGQTFFANYSPAFSDTISLSDTPIVQLLPQSILLSLSEDFAYNDSLQRMATGLEVIASVQDEFFFQDSIVIQSAQSLNSYLRRYLNDVPI